MSDDVYFLRRRLSGDDVVGRSNRQQQASLLLLHGSGSGGQQHSECHSCITYVHVKAVGKSCHPKLTSRNLVYAYMYDKARMSLVISKITLRRCTLHDRIQCSTDSLTALLDNHLASKHSPTALLDDHIASKHSLTALLDCHWTRRGCWRKSLKRRNHVSADLLIKICDEILCE